MTSLRSDRNELAISNQDMEQAREKGKRWVISTREEMRQTVIDVVREAKRKVSIFTHDLEPGIYDDPDFLEIIKRLVLSQAYARIRVLIADPTRAIKSGNNFVHLGRRLNTYIEFRHVREDLRTHAEAFCIADETALVYRLEADRWEGIADTYEPAVARLYGKMFDEIWLASEVELEFRQIGV
jgi:sugar-specific transcriptional regulator TrmB